MAVTAQQILATIRDNASADYIARVPEYTRNNLSQVGDAITSDGNIMNEFITALVDKVAFSNVKSKMYKNPLARLKGTGVPRGNTIEEIFINPATDAGYQADSTKLLATTTPDGKVCYYGMNRQSCYPQTIFVDELTRAFTDEQEFMSLYNAIVMSAYSGDEIDEFMITKGVIGKAIDGGAIKMISADIAQPKEVAKAISNLSKAMTFPSTAFSGYNLVNATAIANGEKACMTHCPTSEQCLIVRADVQTEIDYEVLATMFHMEVAKLEAMTILVDEIPSENWDVYCVLCDVESVQMRDKLYKTEIEYIKSSLKTNIWVHHWQWVFFSMFGNAVGLGKEIVTP